MAVAKAGRMAGGGGCSAGVSEAGDGAAGSHCRPTHFPDMSSWSGTSGSGGTPCVTMYKCTSLIFTSNKML
jgi:hypothetical protein